MSVCTVIQACSNRYIDVDVHIDIYMHTVHICTCLYTSMLIVGWISACINNTETHRCKQNHAHNCRFHPKIHSLPSMKKNKDCKIISGKKWWKEVSGWELQQCQYREPSHCLQAFKNHRELTSTFPSLEAGREWLETVILGQFVLIPAAPAGRTPWEIGLS